MKQREERRQRGVRRERKGERRIDETGLEEIVRVSGQASERVSE